MDEEEGGQQPNFHGVFFRLPMMGAEVGGGGRPAPVLGRAVGPPLSLCCCLLGAGGRC